MNSSKEITFRTKQIHKRRFFSSANLFFLRRDEKLSFVYLCIRIRAKEITALGSDQRGDSTPDLSFTGTITKVRFRQPRTLISEYLSLSLER